MRLLLLSLLMITCSAYGQSDADMDELAFNAPTTRHITVEQLAQYFTKNTTDQRSRVRAIFAWITLHIRYLDTSNASDIWATPEHLDRQRPEQVLKNRTAVCQGFANLFQALAEACGMESQVITGIVKNEDREVMRVGHAWVATEVNGRWQLFDPTWSLPMPGMGWHVNNTYFMPDPERFVLNHLPDDPAWQLLENPLHEADFRGNDDEDLLQLIRREPLVVFDFQDTLQQWITLDSVSRTFSAENRILQFNGSNQRVVFGLGQGYWGLFFDLRAHLDSLADRSIMQDSILIDTVYFMDQLALMEQYHRRARALFNQITDPDRLEKTQKFHTPKDVDAITSKLRGTMWTAVFENRFSLSSRQINEVTLQELKAISDAAEQMYRRSLKDINCAKLGSTCYEIWHNLSLVHLQLAERYSLFAQNLLAEKNASRYLPTTEMANKTAQELFTQAEAETRQLMLIPPPYAFVRDRLQSIRQGLYTVQVNEIRKRRIAIASQVETALNASRRGNAVAKSLTNSWQGIIDDLTVLSQNIEDAYGELGEEYCAVTLFNLSLEAYSMKFNLSSLHFRTALDMYQTAVEKNTLPDERDQIESQAKKALTSLRETGQSLDFLEKSKRISDKSIQQRATQINQLNISVREFLSSL